MCNCCNNRHEYFEKALQAYNNILFLFEEAKRTFNEAIDLDDSLCFACKFWLKTRYGLFGGKNEKKKN